MSSASSSSSVAGIRKRGRQDEPNTPVPPPSTRLNQPTSPLIRNSSAPSDPSPAQRGQTPLGSPVHAALTASPIGSTVEQRKQTLLYQLSPLYIPSTLPSLEEHKRTLYELLERTMTSQHNNACLLVGYSGSGKTALTRSVLHDLRRHYQPLGRSFTVVYLNGRLHADDTLAMREIVRQLSVDMEVEKPPASADFNTNLAFLQTLLASSHYTSQPVFFILDNFDLFAHPPPAKQTLLYNLCDLLQSSRSQLALLAHTVRIDAFDLLEKRIKSRMFSRRLLFPHLPKEEQVVAVVRDRLLLDGERLKRGLRRPSGRGGVEEFDFVPGDTVEGEDDEWMSGEVSVELERHNEAVERMLADETLRATLAHHFKLGKNVRWFLTILVSVRTTRALPQSVITCGSAQWLCLFPRSSAVHCCTCTLWSCVVLLIVVRRTRCVRCAVTVLTRWRSSFCTPSSAHSITTSRPLHRTRPTLTSSALLPLCCPLLSLSRPTRRRPPPRPHRRLSPPRPALCRPSPHTRCLCHRRLLPVRCGFRLAGTLW